MRILFNLAHHRGNLEILSRNDVGTAHAILSRICLDNGLPVQVGTFDKNISLEHMSVYEGIKSYVEDKLLFIPTPDVAILSDLGNLQFQLTLHNRE